MTILIGDSYGAGWTPKATYTGWCEGYANILSYKNEQAVYKYEGGAGFVNQGNNIKATFIDLLDAVKVDSPADVTKIIVCGGHNDQWHSDDAVEKAIKQFFEIARKKYPNAWVHVGMIGHTTDKDRNTRMYNTAKVYQQVTSQCGGIYMGGLEEALLDEGSLCEDGIHPSKKGYEILTKAIWNASHGTYKHPNGYPHRMLSGWARVACSKPESINASTVSFPTGYFKSTPCVTIGVIGSYPTLYEASVCNIAKEGFTVKGATHEYPGNVDIYWIACEML